MINLLKGVQLVSRGTIPKNKRGKKTKEYCILHSIKRAKERYDLELSEIDIHYLNRMIAEGNPDIIISQESQTNTRTLCEIKYKDIILPCVYDKRLHTISSILPEGWREYVDRRVDFREEGYDA
jgi:hypothetical protein